MSVNTNLEQVAYIDELTGLRNKNGLYFDFDEKNLGNLHFIYVDIDDFKKMNTVFGIDAVDEMLKVITASLLDYCGKSDVYRIGAGQFVLVTESHIICEPKELQRLLIQPVVFRDLQVVVNASICVLDHDDFPKTDIYELLKFMQLTIDIEKKKGHNQLVFANNDTRELYLEKKEIVHHLVEGVRNKEFFPKFQPFMDTFTNEVIGFEAVSRWCRGDHMLRPVFFLEAAQWTGLIYDIEMYIFEEAVKFFRQLKDDKSVKLSKRFKAAVHFSPNTLKRIEISDMLDILNEYNISHTDIIIEVQEKYISDPDTYNKIKEIRNRRFMVLLDEFNNNNASLSELADLKVDSMKLSEELLENIDNDQEFTRMMNVYKFLVDVAKKFNITVVSDGINSKENAKLVKDLDVHIGLGKFYSRAVVKEEFVDFIKTNKRKR